MVTIYGFVRRKAGLTHEQFRDHYEKNHAPLTDRLVGGYYAEYRRFYPEGGGTFPLIHFAPEAFAAQSNESPSVTFDCLTILRFRDAEQFEAFNAVRSRPEIFNQIFEDEGRFVDRVATQVLVVKDVCSSTP